MSRVLLVDDDIELAAMLREYLEQEGFEAVAVHDGESGVREALSGRYAIAVLDVMMPRLNGVEALRQIRAGSRLPVLMLTARGDDIDRIIGLELGADDYVPKPCSPRELVARLRAILRRVAGTAEASTAAEPLVVGPLSMWPERRSASWRQQPLDLTSTEFSILEVLARQAGRVVSKSEISELALGRPLARFDRSIDVHVSSIRQKLGARPDGSSWIQTIRGQGYQLVKA
ncbi:MAG TPA: response regulator transcription factor [Accumulibacter sp.]|uniref:response regulator transcription factor n=1 Tax=Accumulibacter sp. TaxID=2053492 RepID=UPI000EEF3416|nr:response regulator transcription factor [Accumulibacter sp.]HCZ16798.1 DNA-binding response regulator [Accumulibacter sp.]HRF71585.1 response regulator transcription factor [Accumulibacter sp.]